MTYHFDVPDFDDCGGRTTRRVEVPNSIVKLIAEAERQKILIWVRSCYWSGSPEVHELTRGIEKGQHNRERN